LVTTTGVAAGRIIAAMMRPIGPRKKPRRNPTPGLVPSNTAPMTPKMTAPTAKATRNVESSNMSHLMHSILVKRNSTI
jgi:hypothetical protein